MSARLDYKLESWYLRFKEPQKVSAPLEMHARKQRPVSSTSGARKRDVVYAVPCQEIADFTFDETVAKVFPDMIQRSVPGYSTVTSMIGVLAARYAQEISRKRTALENVLIPETLAAHRERIYTAGFSRCEIWFQCFNFASLLVRK